jgi:hypothetical protein
LPSPVSALKRRNSDPGVTNIRNIASPYWRRFVGIVPSRPRGRIETRSILIIFTVFTITGTTFPGTDG